jgi:hypothetical protein
MMDGTKGDQHPTVLLDVTRFIAVSASSIPQISYISALRHSALYPVAADRTPDRMKGHPSARPRIPKIFTISFSQIKKYHPKCFQRIAITRIAASNRGFTLLMKNSVTYKFEFPEVRDECVLLGKTMARANDYFPSLDDRFIVEDLLNKGQIAIFCGAPNIGKTAILAAIAASVAKGNSIACRETCKADVVYIGAEDATGVLDRAFHHFLDREPDDASFNVFSGAVDLTDGETVERIIRASIVIAERLNAAGSLLLVIDTLNLCIGEGDENSTRDMSRVIGNAQRIAKETGACVLIVHHTGAQSGDRPRGASSVMGNADTVLIAKKDESGPAGSVLVWPIKQRSTAKTRPLAFQIRPFPVGYNSRGRMISVPIAVDTEPDEGITDDHAEPVQPMKAPLAERRVADAKAALDAFDEENPRGWADVAAIRSRLGESFTAVLGNPDSLRKKLGEALAQLVREGAVESGPGKTFRITVRH